MRHIKQINSNPYTVVVANEPLEEHLSVVDNPDLFVIVDADLPEYVQYLIYN